MNVKKFSLVYIALAFMLGTASADVQWSRLSGKVKAINGKTSQVTIQNKEGDLLTVKVDQDVMIARDKETVAFKDVAMDDKITLLYMPKAPAPKEDDENAYTGQPLPNKR